MSKQRITSIIATCLDCNWKSENYKNAIRVARYHSQTRKHTITIEVTKQRYMEAEAEKP